LFALKNKERSESCCMNEQFNLESKCSYHLHFVPVLVYGPHFPHNVRYERKQRNCGKDVVQKRFAGWNCNAWWKQNYRKCKDLDRIPSKFSPLHSPCCKPNSVSSEVQLTAVRIVLLILVNMSWVWRILSRSEWGS